MVVKINRLIPLLIAFSGLCFSAYLESRSFVLGYAAALVFLGLIWQRSRSRTIYPWLMISALICLGACLTLMVKSGSTYGRVLIYKISANIFKDHYIAGVGSGNFKHYYPHYQAAYFKQGDYTEQELLLADNTYYAFNDYWQFILEWGIFGSLALLFVGVPIVYIICRIPTSDKTVGVADYTSRVFLIAIGVAACFNHVFEQWHIQATFVICLSIVTRRFLELHRTLRTLHLLLTFFSLALIIVGGFGYKISAGKAYRQWHEAAILRRLGYVNQSLDYYEDAYSSLKSNGSFLVDYAELLMSIRCFERAIEKFDEAKRYRVHHSMYLSLAICYRETERLEEAEQALLNAVYLVPNRFESRFALFEYYKMIGSNEEAMRWGKSILSLPIKVPSRRVELIKREVARSLLLNNKLSQK